MQSFQSRRRKLEKKKRKRLEKQLAQEGLISDRTVFVETSELGLYPMSDALEELAIPVFNVPTGSSEQAYAFALQLTAMVWNASVAMDGNIEDVIEELTPQWLKLGIPKDKALRFIWAIATHKLERFPADSRWVLDVEAHIENGELKIKVASGVR